MPSDLVDKIPAWLKSLWDMENELRSAARNGLDPPDGRSLSPSCQEHASTWRRQ